MTQYWFKPKRYGYGATPVTWQGWTLTIATVVAMVLISVTLRVTERSYWTLVALIAFDVAALATLAIVSYWKTEDGLHWRWGADNKS
ncbi:MAG: hypothetical protein P8Y53_11695 [Pseudolabrys sp.]|jgi:uncharacterized membrane protein